MATSLSSLFGSSASSGTSGSSSAAASASSSSTGGTPAPSEEVFLQLLVSQIQNQDPLNPTDSTQFVSQLAQFSELEQVVAIRSDIETAMSSSAQQSPANPATPSSTPDTSANLPGGTAANPTSNSPSSTNPAGTSIN
jgi:flagellar basal-body rod modification protein FlgD